MNQESKLAFTFVNCFNNFKDKTLFVDTSDKEISYGEFFNSCLKLKKAFEKKN